MSLEAVVLQQLQSRSSHRSDISIRNKDEPIFCHDDLFNEITHSSATVTNLVSTSSSNGTLNKEEEATEDYCMSRKKKRKRRRDERREVEEDEVERQRTKHIQVERNRRKQMNNNLSILRSLMPPSYSLRGDQASIVEGAINFVKELEQFLHYLESQHHHHHHHHHHKAESSGSDFFSFPQYSTLTTKTEEAVADVEVRVVERHVTVKVLSKKQPKQLLRVLLELASAHLTILHLNVTSFDAFLLYSFSLKKEDECQLNTVNEIATIVYDIITTIQHGELKL